MSGGNWLAADLGANGWRCWAMSGDTPGALETFGADTGLDVVVSRQAGLPVVACGAPGAPVVPAPCSPLDVSPVSVGSAVHLVPGISQKSPALEMRGAETRVAGFLTLNPNWDGIICLPGPRTHWVQVSAREIVSFQSSVTGEMLAALSRAPSLAHIGGEWNHDDFSEALSETMSRPERLATRLAALGAEDGSKLIGLLLGGELAATKPYWLGQQVAVIGAEAGPYVAALEAQGVPVTQTDEARMTVAGLAAAWRRVSGET